ncbi:hypothetical protein V5N11_032876 [Cardamine amara subsp. amara]|uniref:Uncharacterized protein n=1 Tax=Cardamine amara subsp. amara TaxID=228776 RepID=A0ABD1BLH0_CARAN
MIYQFINYKNNPNLSYRSTNVANPQDQVYPPQLQQNKPFVQYNQNQYFIPKQPKQGVYQEQAQALNPPYVFKLPQPQVLPNIDMKNMLQHILQGQANGAIEQTKRVAQLKNHMDCSYNELNNKFQILNSRLKYLENLSSFSSTKPTCQLPGKVVQNPKDFVNVHVIELRTAKVLAFKKRHTSFTEYIDVQSGEDVIQTEAEAEKSMREGKIDSVTRPAGRAQSTLAEKPV